MNGALLQANKTVGSGGLDKTFGPKGLVSVNNLLTKMRHNFQGFALQ
jgi:hypothetical protein